MGVALPLFLYQLAWLAYTARLKIYLKSRQIGITFAETLDLVQRCMHTKQKWYYLSVSEARAAEAIEYAMMHCLAIGVIGAKITTDWMEFERVKYRHCTITFPNGSKIIGLPANARTARGASGNLVLDEFAHHLDAAAIWTAVAAYAVWGFHIHIISSPNGQQGEFFRIWSNGRTVEPEAIQEGIENGLDPVNDLWSRHCTTIHQAKDDGHPVDLEEHRELAGTEDNWLQEYCCHFLDEAMAWIPYSLLQSCTDDRATLHYDSSQPPAGPCYLGFDVGRKRDLSVGWLNEQVGKVAIPRAVITMHKAPFTQQTKVLWDLMGIARRGHIDETGIGIQLAEETVARFGELHAKGVPFAGSTPARLATKVRGAMERREQLVPDDEHIRRDFHSVRRVYTVKGKQSFEAERTKDGHADRFWACALALDAQSEGWDGLKAGDIKKVGKKSRYAGMSNRGDGYGGY